MHVGRGAGRGQRLIIEAETHKVTIPERKRPIMVDVKHMRRFASVPGHKDHSMAKDSHAQLDAQASGALNSPQKVASTGTPSDHWQRLELSALRRQQARSASERASPSSCFRHRVEWRGQGIA